MSQWLCDVRDVLDRSNRFITFFFRDDDAGWADPSLRPLLAIFEKESVPLDLAVIPEALGASIAVELQSRKRDHPHLLGLHQHGFAHTNHEPSGRKCEFGASRERREQMRDIESGRLALCERLGSGWDAIFTPPWNRCTQATIDCLAELGYRALSRDHAPAPPALGKLAEIPINVDWCRKQNGARVGLPELGRAIAQTASDAPHVGIMLHHAVMGAGDYQALSSLLRLLAGHPAARCRLMRELVGNTIPRASIAAGTE